MTAELAFEYLLAAQESTRGTAVNPPTHYLNMAGVVTPRNALYRPNESRGIRAKYTRSKIVRTWSEWQADGPADVFTLPVLLGMGVKGGVTGTTVATGVYLWTFAPTMNADNLKSGTLYWGDPNVQAFQMPFGLCQEITISSNVGSTDGVMMGARGIGNMVAKTAPSSLPSMLTAPLLAPSDLQLYIDTTTIGSTAVTGRVISAEAKIASGAKGKWVATGPTGSNQYTLVGLEKANAELKLVMEIPDLTQYDQWVAGTVLKARVRWNGPVISTTYRHYIEFDIYGPFDALEWGEYEGTNRTVALTIYSEYDTTAGYDYAVKVENNRSTL